MRRILISGLCIALGGCSGYNTWWNPPFTSGYGPNTPRGDSPNMRRILGAPVAVPALTPEPGDIWPGPVPEMPTLQDIERETGLGRPPVMPATPSAPQSSQALPPSTTPPPADPSGRIITAPSGPGVTSGGTQGYQTTTTPRGSAIIIPNNNGTSTIIHPDGRIETVPTPR